jgi:hypothetical protein
MKIKTKMYTGILGAIIALTISLYSLLNNNIAIGIGILLVGYAILLAVYLFLFFAIADDKLVFKDDASFSSKQTTEAKP